MVVHMARQALPQVKTPVSKEEYNQSIRPMSFGTTWAQYTTVAIRCKAKFIRRWVIIVNPKKPSRIN